MHSDPLGNALRQLEASIDTLQASLDKSHSSQATDPMVPLLAAELLMYRSELERLQHERSADEERQPSAWQLPG